MHRQAQDKQTSRSANTHCICVFFMELTTAIISLYNIN